MVYSNLAPRVNIDEVFPEGSLYKPIQPDFVAMFARSIGELFPHPTQDIVLISLVETSTPTAVYAKGVVDEVLKKSPAAWYWSGGLSTMTWLLSVFAPRGITVRSPYLADSPLLTSTAGLDIHEAVWPRQVGGNRAHAEEGLGWR